MQPGPDFNPYAAPADQADRSMANLGEGYGPSGPLATLGQRFGGSMLDTLFLLVACAPGGVIGALINSSSADRTQDERTLVWAGLCGAGVLIVLLRSWVVAMLGAIPFIGSFIGIIDAALIFREDRRTLHDHIAGTNVIQVL